jgi:hypothetical protein
MKHQDRRASGHSQTFTEAYHGTRRLREFQSVETRISSYVDRFVEEFNNNPHASAHLLVAIQVRDTDGRIRGVLIHATC